MVELTVLVIGSLGTATAIAGAIFCQYQSWKFKKELDQWKIDYKADYEKGLRRIR